MSQTFGDFELIIVNDCSTDDTGEIADAYAQADPRVRVIHNAFNKKLPLSLNTGFEQAGENTAAGPRMTRTIMRPKRWKRS